MFIDIHTHVTPTKTTTRANGSTYTTPEELIATLDREGTQKAVLLPMPIPEGNHRCVSSEDVIEIAAQHPDRFIPFCSVDPRQINNSPDSDFMPHLEYYKSAGCKGVGEMTANLAFDNPLVENLFKHVEAVGLPLLFHIGHQFGGCYGLVDSFGLPKLEAAMQKFPKLVFIGHSQPFWSEISADVTNETWGGYPKGPVTRGRISELMSKYPNLWGDISAGSGQNALSRDAEFGFAFMEEFQDRLLFGTDICRPGQELPQPGFLRQIVAEGKISQAAYEKITWQNANKLLNLGL